MGLAQMREGEGGRQKTLVELCMCASLGVSRLWARELKSPISKASLSLTKLYSSESFNAQVDKGIT